MILVSQNRKKIINFEKIAEIIVSDKDICVTDNFEVQNGLIIATYESEERAKEVLQEIVNVYSSYLNLRGGKSLMSRAMDIPPNIFNIPKVYEMPIN